MKTSLYLYGNWTPFNANQTYSLIFSIKRGETDRPCENIEWNSTGFPHALKKPWMTTGIRSTQNKDRLYEKYLNQKRFLKGTVMQIGKSLIDYR